MVEGSVTEDQYYRCHEHFHCVKVEDKLHSGVLNL